MSVAKQHESGDEARAPGEVRMSSNGHRPDPLEPEHLMAPGRQCTATSKQSGQQCRRPAIAGGFVCRFHGGAAPQVKDKARERLAMLVEPALAKLAKLVKQDKNPAVALGAVKDVLDRNNLTGKTEPSVNVNLTKIERVVINPPDSDR